MTPDFTVNTGPNGATALPRPASPINASLGSASPIILVRSPRTSSSTRTYLRFSALYLPIRLSMAISSSRLRRKMARRRFDDHSRPRERPIADRSPSRLSPNPQLANHGNCDRGEETRRRLSSIQRVLAPLVVCRCPKRACDTTAYQRFRSSYRGAIRLPHRALCVPGASQRNARGSEPNVTFRPEFAFFRPLIPDTTL